MMLSHLVRWALAKKWMLGWEGAHSFHWNSGEWKKASARGGSLAVWEETHVLWFEPLNWTELNIYNYVCVSVCVLVSCISYIWKSTKYWLHKSYDQEIKCKPTYNIWRILTFALLLKYYNNVLKNSILGEVFSSNERVSNVWTGTISEPYLTSGHSYNHMFI